MDEKENVQGAGTEPETKPDENKTFTQEEVNAIIQQRLAREKEKAKPEQDAALAAKELALAERELQLQAKELLMDKGLPKELSGIIKANDEKGLKEAIELLSKYIKTEKEQPSTGFRIGTAGHECTGDTTDSYRRVMGLD